MELSAVRCLIDNGFVVVTVGGGGIPVIKEENGSLSGVAAVIDKDLASERLSEDVNADTLLILTAVEKAYINFGKENQQALDTISTEQAREYMAQGHFAPGSMLPKMDAACRFAESKKGRRSVITSLDKAIDALEGKTGTTIVNE